MVFFSSYFKSSLKRMKAIARLSAQVSSQKSDSAGVDMVSRMNCILIIGGTSGIGEAFARQFYAMGKKVVVAGRRTERLNALANELQGLETVQWDITDLNALGARVSSVLAAFPKLDTVFINAGIQKLFSFLDPASSSPESVIAEINSNLTAPLLLARLFLPHLQSLANAGTPANLLITSSALAFVPLSLYPIYCPTKAAIHSFCIVLRQQLAYAPEAIKKHLNIVEIVPPYTDTDLDREHRAVSVEMQGGPDKAFKPMPLDEFVQQAFEGLKAINTDGRARKEVAVGFGQTGVDTWRGGFGKILESMGIDC